MSRREDARTCALVAGDGRTDRLATAGYGASTGRFRRLLQRGVLPSSPGTTRSRLALTYTRSTEKTKLHNYFFDTFGPYPIVGAALAAGINQIAAVSTTTR